MTYQELDEWFKELDKLDKELQEHYWKVMGSSQHVIAPSKVTDETHLP